MEFTRKKLGAEAVVTLFSYGPAFCCYSAANALAQKPQRGIRVNRGYSPNSNNPVQPFKGA